MAIEDYIKKSEGKEIDYFTQEISILKLLVRERRGPFDLVRELLSNAAAKEVGATKIEITYTIGKEGHMWEISDNGCGMNYLGSDQIPGRLDRFLGLGLSSVIGLKSDEFGFKGLGSKLAFQSKALEVETKYKSDNNLHNVKINEPWSSLERNLKPKPRLSTFEDKEFPIGTKIKIIGHPPDAEIEQHNFSDIKDFVLHRTFLGFTRDRANPPEIIISILGKQEKLGFGFPELKMIPWENKELNDKGLFLDKNKKTLFVNLIPKSSKKMRVVLKGFLTWIPEDFNLPNSDYSKGLILSTKGIPYFELDLEELGARAIATANPGYYKTCLIVECDKMHTEMNISRSDLIDSREAREFKKVVQELFENLETSKEYLEFRQIPKEEKHKATASYILDEKKSIESEEQNWVVFEREGEDSILLMREPQYEDEVNAILWKLEALNALPFKDFRTLAYIGSVKGPDLLVHFQEDDESEPIRGTAFEVEKNFYYYKTHGHIPSQ